MKILISTISTTKVSNFSASAARVFLTKNPSSRSIKAKAPLFLAVSGEELNESKDTLSSSSKVRVNNFPVISFSVVASNGDSRLRVAGMVEHGLSWLWATGFPELSMGGASVWSY